MGGNGNDTSSKAMVSCIPGRSNADNGSGGYYGYRMSKAALNAAAMSLSRDLRRAGVAVAILHPGYVRTDMTGGGGTVGNAIVDHPDIALITFTGSPVSNRYSNNSPS